MLTTRQTVFRKFWHAVMPLSHLVDGPKTVPPDGRRHRAVPRCRGKTQRACATAAATARPGSRRAGARRATSSAAITAGPTTAAARWSASRRSTPMPRCRATMSTPTGAWRATATPGWRSRSRSRIVRHPRGSRPRLSPHLPVLRDWKTAPMRLMENSFDNAHFAFVHRGDLRRRCPAAPKQRYETGGNRLRFPRRLDGGILNPPEAHQVTGVTDPTTPRAKCENHWYLPFCRRWTWNTRAASATSSSTA